MKAVVNAAKANPIKTGSGAALILAVGIIAPLEGLRNDPYNDIVGIRTVCYGETQNIEERHYTTEECRAKLEKAVGERYLKPVADCVPQIAARPEQLAASTSLAYNIGIKSFCGSTAAKRFRAGDIKGGCEAFTMWAKAGGKVVRGLVKRREAEKALCLTGVA